MKSSTYILISFVLAATFFTLNRFHGSVLGKKDDFDVRVKRDLSLVAPGTGAEGVALGEDIGAVLKRFGRVRFRISKPPGPRELFKDVLGVDGAVKLFFDRIYYNDDKKIAFCVLHERVNAVIGISGDRTTTHGVELGKGIDNLIFNYGNRDLVLIRAGTNGIYLYRNMGIAVMDDGMNDSIDLYVVFSLSAN